MFGGKQLEEIKEILDKTNSRMDELISQTNKNNEDLDLLKCQLNSEVSSLKDQMLGSSYELTKELKNIEHQSSKFERCVGSFENMKSNLDQVLESKLRILADHEIKKIKDSLSNINHFEKDFKELAMEVNTIRSELEKFNQISKEIKLVDFTLSKHVKDIERLEREKLKLEDENDQLKSLMAKFKRNRSFQR